MGYWRAISLVVGGPFTYVAVEAGVQAYKYTRKKRVSDLEEARQKGREEGRQEEKVRGDLTQKQLNEAVKKVQQQLEWNKEHFQHIIVLHMLGLTMGHADGEMSPEEEHELSEFCAGAACSTLPEPVKEAIACYTKFPPTLQEIMREIRKLHRPFDFLSKFEDVMKLVAESDGHVCDREKAFLHAFRTEMDKLRVEHQGGRQALTLQGQPTPLTADEEEAVLSMNTAFANEYRKWRLAEQG